MRRILAFLLIVWEPATLALTFSAILDRIVDRGAAAVLLLVLRVVVAGVGIAAGLVLWTGRQGGIALARAAMALSLAAVLVTSMTRAWPLHFPPGLHGPATVLLVAYDGAWLVWLFRQRT